MFLQPAREFRQPGQLRPVHYGVAVGVVADEHLGEGGIEGFDVFAESRAVLEVELGEAALLDRHSEYIAASPRSPRHLRTELLVDARDRVTATLTVLVFLSPSVTVAFPTETVSGTGSSFTIVTTPAGTARLKPAQLVSLTVKVSFGS